MACTRSRNDSVSERRCPKASFELPVEVLLASIAHEHRHRLDLDAISDERGRVIEADPKQGRVLIENVNMIVRHQRPRPIQNASRMGGPQIIPGGRIEMAAPVPVSNVMVVCPTCGKPTRVGTHLRETKDKTLRVRVCKNPECGQEIDR
jgi:large subunit ribosomal protein L24